MNTLEMYGNPIVMLVWQLDMNHVLLCCILYPYCRIVYVPVTYKSYGAWMVACHNEGAEHNI